MCGTEHNWIIALVMGLFLTGCACIGGRSSTDTDLQHTYAFSCDDGYAFTAKVDGKRARLYTPDGRIKAHQDWLGAGTLYVSGQTRLWIAGQSARLDRPGHATSECRNDTFEALREDARMRGVDFRGVGTEPGWIIEIWDDGKIDFLADYGENRYLFPTPEPQIDPSEDRRRYLTQNKEHQLTLTMEPGPCNDGMSDNIYSQTLHVMLDERPYRGCGDFLPPWPY